MSRLCSASHLLLVTLLVLACGPVAPMTMTTDDADTGSNGAGSSSTGAGLTTAGAGGSTTAPTTTDATSTGAVDPSGTSTGPGSFINPGDWGGCGVAFGEYEVRCSLCDLWTQDCSPGEKCTPYSSDGDSSWDSQKCVPIDPNPGQVGDPCTTEGIASGLDSCDISAMCWNVDAMTMEGTCVGFCEGSESDPICPQGTSCAIANEGVLILCLPDCDPLLQDCAANDVCIPNPMNPDSFICVIDASGDEGQEWDPCEYLNACDPGLACVAPTLSAHCDPMANGCCAAFCDLSGPNCTDPAEECVPWYNMGMAPPDHADLGVCGIPQ